MKPRSREIECYNDRFALKFDRHLGSVAAEVPVKFQSNWKSLNPNLATSRDFTRSCGKTSYGLVNRGPEELELISHWETWKLFTRSIFKLKLSSWMDRWVPQSPTDNKSTLVQVMASCRLAKRHYLGHCWPRSISPLGHREKSHSDFIITVPADDLTPNVLGHRWGQRWTSPSPGDCTGVAMGGLITIYVTNAVLILISFE